MSRLRRSQREEHHAVRLLGRPWWQGVGAILTLLSVVVAIGIAASCDGPSGTTESSDSENGQAGTGNAQANGSGVQQGGGNCYVLGGSQNSVTCDSTATTTSGANPITLTVSREKTICNSYIIPSPIEDVGPPPNADASSTAWSDWALGKGGADLDWTKVLITVRGTGKNPVTITGLAISIKDEGPPLDGSYLEHPCGSETVGRYAEIDLDQTPPRIETSSSVPITWGDDAWRATPLQFPYTVTDTDSESLLIIGKTRQYRAWTASISWTDGQSSGTEIIDYQGKPFKTTSHANAQGYIEMDGAWVPY
jgi:hypothetical protein